MKIKSKKSPLFNDEKELAKFLLKDVTKSLEQAIKFTVKITVKEEMEEIRKGIDEKISFNGHYQRHLTSPIGRIENIDIPRFREKQNSELNLSSLNIFNEEKEKFIQIVQEMHRLGISQRKVAKLCKTCFGIKMNKNRVGKVHKELAQKEEFKINSQIIDDEFKYLFLDGLWVKCKTFGLSDKNDAVLLCALGVNETGERKILGFKFSRKEDYENWNEFILSLKERGLTKRGLKLIVTDDNKGLQKSLKYLFPKVSIQNCITHKIRNSFSKSSYKNRKEISGDLKTIYEARTKKEANKRREQFSKKWYVREERAVSSLNYNFEKTLTYLEFSRDEWTKIRTTNILEREFREVRRRIKVFDNSFENPESVNRYADSIFNHLNKNYPESLHTKY